MTKRTRPAEASAEAAEEQPETEQPEIEQPEIEQPEIPAATEVETKTEVEDFTGGPAPDVYGGEVRTESEDLGDGTTVEHRY